MKNYLFLAALLATTAVHAQVTWSETIAPIVYDHCSRCHHDGGIGPFPLMSYEDAFNTRFDIEYAVTNDIMPPWPADPDYRHFAYENVLSAGEVDAIVEWVAANGPEGNPDLAPDAPVFTNESALPAIDFTASTGEYTSEAANQDVYRTFVIPSGLAEDTFIDGFEIIPGNASIVHHVVVYYDPTDDCLEFDAEDPGPGFTSSGTGGGLPEDAHFMAVWAPGKNTQLLPQGFGLRAEAGGYYLIEVHYPAGSSGETDNTVVNVHYTDDNTPREVWLNPILVHIPPILQAPFLYIPANEVVTFEEHYQLPLDVTLFGVSPHMHLIGTSITSWAETPEEETIPLIHIPEWDFHWQLGYDYPQLLHIPVDSWLKASAVYDNTTDNPHNPNNPPQPVFAGEATDDEMMIVFFTYTYYLPGDEDIVVDPSLSVAAPTVPDAALKVFPNPASDAATLHLFSPHFGDVHFSILDAQGRVWKEWRQRVPGGLERIPLDVQELPSGMYFVRARGEFVDVSATLVVGE